MFSTSTGSRTACSPRPSFYGTDNSLLLSALDAHPERLRGTVIVAPDVDDSALHAMAGRGVVGIRLNWVRRDALPDVTGAAYRSASDWPFVSFEDAIKYGDCLRWIRAWIPDEATRRTVMVDTPAALFEFDRKRGRRQRPSS